MVQSPSQNLYLVHCGYYDSEVSEGIFEFHVNLMVAATSVEDARAKAKERPEYRSKRMHIDGLQEICAVDGFVVRLEEDASLNGETRIVSHKHRDLASTKPATPII